MTQQPFVSIVTPVYNGERFLVECIESVLAQGYANWEYIIVNNRSTDRTLALAKEYARRDPRIRVVTNQVFVNCEENHNNAFRQISPQSLYCKVVCADDHLLPHCLETMVGFAVRNPTAGIIGSYQQRGESIRWKGLPKEVNLLSGRAACRMHLLQGVYVLGNPTSVLYRSDLIRSAASFFPHSEPHADTSAFYACLCDCDFGFVHEVMSVSREHEGQVTAGLHGLNAGDIAYLDLLHQYGRQYLSDVELAARREAVLARYYQMLGRCALGMKGWAFWQFHKSRLRSVGYSLDWRRVAIEAMHKLTTEFRHPVAALRKFNSALGVKSTE